jgi:uncharacterized protein YdeI (BOF family)
VQVQVASYAKKIGARIETFGKSFAAMGLDEKRRPKNLSEDCMKKQVVYLSYLGALALLLSAAISLNAQTPQTQPPEPQSQQPTQQAPPDQSAQENPDTQAQPSQKTGVQTFTGSIVKSGTKYMFQDAASGNTYDIDHQDEVQKFDGKKVTVHGTLDANSNTIHIK